MSGSLDARRWLADTSASAWVLCIRLAVGFVFLPEGIQKLVYPELLGSGRFAAIRGAHPN